MVTGSAQDALVRDGSQDRPNPGLAGTPRRAAYLLGLVLLCTLATLAFRWAMATNTSGRWVLPLDDAYIHQQYARQAARGFFMPYNDQDLPSSGATSLLYPLILSLLWRLDGGGDALSVAAFWLGAVTLAISTWLAGRLARRLAGEKAPNWVPPLGSALYLCNGSLLFGHLSGMESGLFLVMLLAYVLALLDDHRGGIVLFGACLAVVRPEGLILALVGGAWILARERAGCSHRRWLTALTPVMAGVLQPLLNLLMTGSPTANGMRVKGRLYGGAPLLDAAGDVLSTFGRLVATVVSGLPLDSALAGDASGAPGLALCLPLALGAFALFSLARRARTEFRCGPDGPLVPGAGSLLIGLVLAILGAAALMMTAEWHYYRYVLPAFALLLPSAAAALAPAASISRLMPWLVATWLVSGAMTLPALVWRCGQAASTVLHKQIALGEWVRVNLPPDARVAVHDAGAIRYYGERATYDMLGLTAPAAVSAAWRDGPGSMMETMVASQGRPGHSAAYPDVAHFPYLATAGIFGQELYRVEHADASRVASAGASQSVYVADWAQLESRQDLQQPDVREIVKGLEAIASINVADAADEARNRYQHRLGYGSQIGLTDVVRLPGALPPHRELTDSGRIITGGERFTLPTRPGADLVLAGRLRVLEDATLDVRVDSVPAGELVAWRYEGAWQERAIRVPGNLVKGDQTVVQVTLREGGAPDYRSYQWWAWQGDLRPCVPMHPVDRANAAGIRLLGYDIAQVGYAGPAVGLRLNMYWLADHATSRDLVVYVHWVDAEGEVLAQSDARPADGVRPTWSWQPGFCFADTVSLVTSRAAQGSDLYLGLYDAATIEPVPLEGADAAGRLLLATPP